MAAHAENERNKKEFAINSSAFKDWINGDTNSKKRRLQRVAIPELMKLITPKERDIIIDRLVFNKSFTEIASERKRNVSSITRAYHRGLENMHEIILAITPVIDEAVKMMDEY